MSYLQYISIGVFLLWHMSEDTFSHVMTHKLNFPLHIATDKALFSSNIYISSQYKSRRFIGSVNILIMLKQNKTQVSY